MNYDELIKILEVSIARNGKDHILTLGHLLNIIRLAQQKHQDEEAAREQFLTDTFNETFQHGE